MPFDHERLEAYQVALEFFDLADSLSSNCVDTVDDRIWPINSDALPSRL